ncbi:MAG: EAL domain-containing protein [Lachnospiraceae bacterium]|nr:EAL domain-containing protein [Lachnospiraceae bacterium]
MDRYQYSREELDFIEKSCIPYAIYQFIDNRVVTLALTKGFLELSGINGREEAYRLMDEDMYRDVHPDDVMKIADAAVDFATGKSGYNVVYRSRIGDEYRIIHAFAEHFYPNVNTRLAVVWYVDEGSYTIGEDAGDKENKIGEENAALSRILKEGLRQDSMLRELNYDYLTGLPSMTYFFKLAEAGRNKMLHDGEDPVLLFLDLSGMKYFNMKYGFAEGDELIKAFAELLKKHFTTESSSRFGQDHFAAFAKADGIEDVLAAIFAEAETINGGRSLPVRVGIYRNSMGDVEPSLACDRAKYACDSNKDELRSAYSYFDQKMLDREMNRQYVVDNLDRALKEGWIRAYFQPIVRTANGRVCDEEALSRWIDPVKGMLSPADFIPILEEHKLIYKVDLHIVDLILRRMKEQKKTGLHIVPMSVNLSRTDFEMCDIVEEIRSRVDAAGFDRSLLTIEITESVIGDNFEYMKEQIERFRELGFQVWMDDFGSGYSSLDVLQDLKFDLIKFDMRFMRQFEKGDKSKIILTELIRMAISLGIETVTEGVETEEQVEFLREVGCTKLQGFYYCKPIPVEEIYERNKKGIQIGFENPRETEYYTAIGGVNLYDLAVVSSGDTESFRQYFDTLPMAVMETDGYSIKVVRCNRTFRGFTERYFSALELGKERLIPVDRTSRGIAFLKAISRCEEDGDRTFIEERLSKNETIHAFIRKLAVNPVTGIAACAVVVLGIISDKKDGVSFAHVARALSVDYIDLYYVDLKTENFIQYRPDGANADMTLERHGDEFFATARSDAAKYLYEPDREMFTQSFRRKNVIRILDESGAFTITYRLVMNGGPVYVSMKVVRMDDDPDHIIVAVNNVDAQMRQQEILERIREESTVFERTSALVGNLIAMYTVNPETEGYIEYSASEQFEKLALAKEGESFFASSREDIKRVIHPEDLMPFLDRFTRENVMKDIEEKGVYSLKYRLLIEDKPVNVCLRAAMIEDREGPRLIVGVNNMDMLE